SFFFSSRRRHTRFSRDWSSDMCSSDLVVTAELDPETERLLHRTIDGVRSDMDGLRFNTAIAKLIELTNRATAVTGSGTPRALAEIGRASCRERVESTVAPVWAIRRVSP